MKSRHPAYPFPSACAAGLRAGLGVVDLGRSSIHPAPKDTMTWSGAPGFMMQ